IITESMKEVRRAIFDDEDTTSVLYLMSFAEFCEFANYYPLSTLDGTFISSAEEEGKEKLRGRFAESPVERIPGFRSYDIHAYSERSYFGELVNILHPYSV